MASIIEPCHMIRTSDKRFVALQDDVNQSIPDRDQRLVTVTTEISDPSTIITHVKTFISQSLELDDVLSPDFLKAIVVPVRYCSSEDTSTKASRLVSTEDYEWIYVLPIKGEAACPNPGPYLLNHGSLIPTWRLYDDTAGAFSLTLKPSKAKGFIPLGISPESHADRCVAVPTRIPKFFLKAKPLQGLRITVKDMYDLSGVKSSLGSRHYLEMCNTSSRTAPAIQRLVDAGAHVVGLSKMCSTVLLQHPTQCIDYPAPFNPRGDGYQSPSGGSSGQAAAIATYEWLDIAIGSDSTASARLPALANGCFSLRPSTGMLPTEGMWSGVPLFDTPCAFGRDLTKFRELFEIWFSTGCKAEEGKPLSRDSFPDSRRPLPQALLYPLSPIPGETPAQAKIFLDVLRDFESALGVSAQAISIEACWQESPPLEAEGQSLYEYLNANVATCTYVYSFWHRIRPFLEEYQERFGRQPYIPPPHGKHLWDDALNVTCREHEEAMARMLTYRRWLKETVFRFQERDALMIWNIEAVHPRYRDEWPSALPKDQQLFDSLLMAPIMGAPELVIPVGELEYKSRITEKKEHLPVCLAMIGAPARDIDLLNIAVDCLQKSGRPTKVEIGSRLFKASRR